MKSTSTKVLILYFCCLTGIFPLFITNYYYNLQLSKCLFFVLLTVLATFCFSYITLFREKKHCKAKQTLSLCELFAFLFCMVVLISGLLSAYGRAAFTGESGRFVGAVLLFSMCLCFILFSRRHINLVPFYPVFLTTGIIVEFLGILQFIGADILALSAHIPLQLTGTYLSTLGNVNVFSCYTSIIAAFSVTLYCMNAKKHLLIYSFISYIALFCANSDGGFLGLMAIFFLLPLFKPTTTKVFLRLLAHFFTFSLSCLIGQLLSLITQSHYSGIPALLTTSWLPTFFVLLSSTLYFLCKKNPFPPSILFHIRRIYIIILILFTTTAILLFLGANLELIDLPALTISDHCGSNRGYIWKKVLYLWKIAPLRQKLVGYGPDTLKLLLIGTCYDEMITVTGQIFDSAHNSILQYLISTGLLGAFSYLFWCLSVLITAFQAKKEEVLPWLLALIACLVQTLIMPDQPVTTPLMFMIAGICVGISRHEPR